MYEQKILASILKDRSNWESIKDHVVEGDFTPQAERIWFLVDEYYLADATTKSVDSDILISRLGRALKNPKHVEMFKTLIKSLPQDVSGINVVKEFLENKRHNLGMEIAHAITEERPDEALKLIEDWRVLSTTEELEQEEHAYEIIEKRSTTDLLSDIDVTNRVPLYPSDLNVRINGGALRGHNVLFFARPEVGKTALALNLLRKPCKLGNKVLYFGNEDPILEVMRRALSSFSGRTWEEHIKDPEKSDALAYENGFGNVEFIDLSPGNLTEVETLVKKFEPCMFVVDQVGNLSYGKSENRTLGLWGLMRGMRRIAKKYKTVAVSLHQAGDSAEGKLILDMGDLEWSNTGMQGQVDLMVGVGVDDAFEAKDWRMFSLPKNKLSGLHGYFPVSIDRTLHRYRSLGN